VANAFGNPVANAYRSDPGVMKLGANNRGTQAQAIEDVEMALRLPEKSGMRVCTSLATLIAVRVDVGVLKILGLVTTARNSLNIRPWF
jgi:hypothetical protein